MWLACVLVLSVAVVGQVVCVLLAKYGNVHYAGVSVGGGWGFQSAGIGRASDKTKTAGDTMPAGDTATDGTASSTSTSNNTYAHATPTINLYLSRLVFWLPWFEECPRVAEGVRVPLEQVYGMHAQRDVFHVGKSVWEWLASTVVGYVLCEPI